MLHRYGIRYISAVRRISRNGQSSGNQKSAKDESCSASAFFRLYGNYGWRGKKKNKNRSTEEYKRKIPLNERYLFEIKDKIVGYGLAVSEIADVNGRRLNHNTIRNADRDLHAFEGILRIIHDADRKLSLLAAAERIIVCTGQ